MVYSSGCYWGQYVLTSSLMTWSTGQSAPSVSLQMLQNSEERLTNHMVMLTFRRMSATWRNRHLGRNNSVYWYGPGADWLGSSFAEKALVVLVDHQPAWPLQQGRQTTCPKLHQEQHHIICRLKV